MEENLQYFHNPENDQLHPNDAGQQRMARTLMYQLLTLPCTF
jgi:lysophospholipase L1-like esterase